MRSEENANEVAKMRSGYIGYKRPFYRAWFLFLLFLLLVPAACQYQPPLRGVAGYETYLATAPGYFGSLMKRIQSFMELTPCQYEMLGWDADNLFYYESVCAGKEQIWQFAPNGAQSQRVVASPNDLYVETVPSKDVLEIVRAVGVRPRKYEAVTRPLLLVEDGLASPDGLYTAVLTQRVYSVYDIVILMKQ